MTKERANRREFLKTCAAAGGAGSALLLSKSSADEGRRFEPVDKFDRPDSLYAGDDWESLNPGYWKIEGRSLRRRLENVGDRARATGFPYHWETHQQKPMPVDYDPSLPYGMIWRRDWKLSGGYAIRADFEVVALSPTPPSGEEKHRQHQPGYGLMGVCFGGASLYESWHGWKRAKEAALFAAWRDDGRFGIYDHRSDAPKPFREGAEVQAPSLQPGESVSITVTVIDSVIEARLSTKNSEDVVVRVPVENNRLPEGYFGLVGRGLLGFRANEVSVSADPSGRVESPVNDLHVCYPLVDTLEETGEGWRCRMLALFRSDGNAAEVRVADTPDPEGGWKNVPVAGSARVVTNDFRLNTASLEIVLPENPAKKSLYYTVWKDGVDVTADPRDGFLGRKDYVGRLPQLSAPYKLCGLSCHAINGGKPKLPRAKKFEENWIYDQPTPDAYKHLDDYEFQVMVWEDDIWYLELVLYPPSTDDAYKIITTTIAGPTTRWQMMRHWNILNPGDHDHGMDDVKGPEQLAVRNHSDLGQDRDYLRRNFQIVSHLISGDESPTATGNPKRWRRWKAPDRDFSLLILDSRLWRSSQDTKIWDDEGWGHKDSLYGRSDPTRSLLGEEQFGWLREILKTDSSPLICLTGVNGMHTIWQGGKNYSHTDEEFAERDRVAADYAGWVAAGADRVLELLAGRPGVVSVYGDVHNGSIVRNVEKRVYEASFGPIGRYGGRAVIEGFGPRMKDIDGRELDVLALYHGEYDTPDLRPREREPEYFNFLEMSFDPRGSDPEFELKIRNLIDAPTAAPRGGGHCEETASNTGNTPTCSLPDARTLPNADLLFLSEEGRPVRGARSLPDGTIPIRALFGPSPGERIVVAAMSEEGAETVVLLTETLPTE